MWWCDRGMVARKKLVIGVAEVVCGAVESVVQRCPIELMWL